MLEIKNISKYYNSRKVLNELSFNVNQGKIFGIIGPNGAGKTTTLRIILGITNAGSGNIYFKGKILDQDFQNSTGYLPEERGLYPKSNVLNILVYLAELKGLRYSEAVKKSKYWLDRLNLTEYEKHHIEELSKGNQQKVQFISAIIHEPEILILDEPFSGFDPVNQTIFTQIIEDFKSSKYIILSTHLMDLAENLCDELILINNGNEILSGDIGNILNLDLSNFYSITLKKEINENIFSTELIDRVKRINDFTAEVDLSSTNPAEFIRNISRDYDIIEFKRKTPTLHDIFVSKVRKDV